MTSGEDNGSSRCIDLFCGLNLLHSGPRLKFKLFWTRRRQSRLGISFHFAIAAPLPFLKASPATLAMRPLQLLIDTSADLSLSNVWFSSKILFSALKAKPDIVFR